MEHALAMVEGRERLARWIEEGERALAAVPAILDENARLGAALEAAERECAHLAQELAALRQAHAALLGERSDLAGLIAEGLTRVMNDALRRLRSTPPSSS